MTVDPTSVAVHGHGPLARAFLSRIEKSPLMIDVVDHASPGDLCVREEQAPAGSFLGVAAADRPGELFLHDDRAVGYLVDLIQHFVVTGARSVVVRRPVQIEWSAAGSARKLRKRLRHFHPDHYDWIGSASIDDDVFDGDALLVADGDTASARLRITGAIDPLDGRYHWAGTVFGDDARRWKDERVVGVTVSVGGRAPVDARLAEVTPSGAVRVVGVGQPPYPLDSLVV
ncbi:DUF4873 domain-containing protein [Gordonia insulae]|uniref:DUF4873 domain-containing protein n=1 Tax=Gordonia insulae TaxID=2420509 RepID=A0A3G8JP82_9ACTN|nr:DUF4873 domain-containing protein [Gordonia insulae]AZG46891.1 hypothetical protein D7316_03496 [Gordonia insulae]